MSEMLTVSLSNRTHSYRSPLENVQELIKEMYENPQGYNILVSNDEGDTISFFGPPTRGTKREIREHLMRLQNLI